MEVPKMLKPVVFPPGSFPPPPPGTDVPWSPLDGSATWVATGGTTAVLELPDKAAPFVTAQAVLNVAASWVGYNGGPDYSTPFGTWFGYPNSYWCAEFVSYCLYVAAQTTGTTDPIAGIEGPKGFAAVAAGAAWFQEHGEWHRAHEGYQPKPGDLVCWAFGSDGPGVPSHVGIVTTASDGTGFWTIQGDTTDVESGNGNCCRRKYVFLDNEWLVGFGSPTYGTTTPPKPVASGGTYTVKPGDTLSAIANANHTTVPVLAQLNGIKNANLINIGQVIKLPKAATPAPNPAKPYTAPPGPWYLRTGNFYGNIAGGNESHGGGVAADRPYVGWINQRLHELGYLKAGTYPAQEINGTVVAAIGRWQHARHAATTSLPGEVWSDDWANLITDR